MAKDPEKPAIFKWLLRQDLTGVHSCASLLDTAAQKLFGKDALSAAAYSQATSTAFWNYVLSREIEHAERGLSPSFSVFDSTSQTWNCHPPPTQAVGEPRRNAPRPDRRPALLRMIDELSDRQYEALSCVLLEEMGASRFKLTKRGTEGGIDAFGLFANGNSTHLLASKHHPIRVVVQAKKYSRPTPPDKVKEFITTLDEVKFSGQPKTEAIIPPWFRASRGPIIGLIVSHSGFQSGAESRARSHGILTADSVDIAEILSAAEPVNQEGRREDTDRWVRRVDEIIDTSEEGSSNEEHDPS